MYHFNIVVLNSNLILIDKSKKKIISDFRARVLGFFNQKKKKKINAILHSFEEISL